MDIRRKTIGRQESREFGSRVEMRESCLHLEKKNTELVSEINCPVERSRLLFSVTVVLQQWVLSAHHSRDGFPTGCLSLRIH